MKLPPVTRFRLLQVLWMLGAFAVGALLAVSTANAAEGGADALKLYLEKATTGLPGRVEISIGTLDPRLKLSPCGRVEPYIPAGARLWGKSQLGLRCTEGSHWSVFLPVEVKVFGRALVATRPLPYGQPVGADDVRLEEVEFTKEPGMAISDARQLEGKTTARAITPGQVLRQEYFRTPPAIGAGDIVKVVYTGDGFNISTSGRAIGNAAEGQPVRVQTDAGRVVQGIARSGRVVEMRL
ncbi:MAG TPA: flagellar basal body P-ring formation chaperone FlgA [Burkholderiales bacterium]|jgi:flagella basal body P-ring formation protein FlgA